MNYLLAAFLGLVGVVTTAFLTYVIAKRKNSGNIETTAAEDLWGESRAIREYLAAREAMLLARIDALEKNEQALRAEVAAARAETSAMTARVESERARAEAAGLELTQLHLRLGVLEGGTHG